MNKLKFLTIASILLLCLNIGLITYIVFGKKHPPIHEGPRDIIIEKLHFDQQQVAKYDTLIAKHRKDIRAKNQAILELRKTLYNSINTSPNPKLKDSLMLEVGKTRAAIEQIHFAHFEDIKALCNDTQQQYFVELTSELADYFNENRKPKR